MIPPDVASRLRLNVPDQPTRTQPTPPVRQVTDVLSDLVPGQRLLAEVQALLPNGTYRAIVAQRDVTLALPFSAKSGDSLELEVVENDGKLSLAFVGKRSPGDTAAQEPASVSTSFSSTGKLIGDLLGKVDDQGKHAQATPLNGNQPLLKDFRGEGAPLAPVLKEALTKSGMFYESHQARWAQGQLPTAALLQEPQGKFSSPLATSLASASADQAGAPPPASGGTGNDAIPSGPAGQAPDQSASQTNSLAGVSSGPPSQSTALVETNAGLHAVKDSAKQPLPVELAPVVRQQLDALASENYVWQGQIWPGQTMHWEIEEDTASPERSDNPEARPWQTRLKLTLPGLGGIDAVMRLSPAGTIGLTVVTDMDQSRETLIAGGEDLRQRLEEAGLNLTAFTVQHGETSG